MEKGSVSNSLSSEYLEKDRKPTHLKTRRERDNRSKSLKSTRSLVDLHNSSSTRHDNWILRRSGSEDETPQQHSARRTRVDGIFSGIENDAGLDWSNPRFENNMKQNPSRVKYNSMYRDHNDAPSVSLRHNSAPPVPLRRNDALPVQLRRNDAPPVPLRRNDAPSVLLRRHKVDIEVAPQTPCRGKNLKVSDKHNKYTIQIGSPSMTIQGVTLHKPNQITSV